MFDGALGAAQALGDLRIAEPIQQQIEYLCLAPRQTAGAPWSPPWKSSATP